MNLGDELHEAKRALYQFQEFAKICTCGTPERMWRELGAALAAYHVEDKFAELGWIEENYLLAHVLDAWELTDHGGSIYGSWITPGGRRLRDALKLILFTGNPEVHCNDEETWWEAEHWLNPNGAYTDSAGGFVIIGPWESGVWPDHSNYGHEN